jgi:hypothetical protein
MATLRIPESITQGLHRKLPFTLGPMPLMKLVHSVITRSGMATIVPFYQAPDHTLCWTEIDGSRRAIRRHPVSSRGFAVPEAARRFHHDRRAAGSNQGRLDSHCGSHERTDCHRQQCAELGRLGIPHLLCGGRRYGWPRESCGDNLQSSSVTH